MASLKNTMKGPSLRGYVPSDEEMAILVASYSPAIKLGEKNLWGMDLQKLVDEQQKRDGIITFTKEEVGKFINDFIDFQTKNSQLKNNQSNDSGPKNLFIHPLLLKKKISKSEKNSTIDSSSLTEGIMLEKRSGTKKDSLN